VTVSDTAVHLTTGSVLPLHEQLLVIWTAEHVTEFSAIARFFGGPQTLRGTI